MFTGSKDKTVKIFNVDVAKKDQQVVKIELKIIKHLDDIHNDIIRTLFYDSDEKLLVTGSWDKTVNIFEVNVVIGEVKEKKHLENLHY